MSLGENSCNSQTTSEGSESTLVVANHHSMFNAMDLLTAAVGRSLDYSHALGM